MRHPAMPATSSVLIALVLQACDRHPATLSPDQDWSPQYAATAKKKLDVDRCAFGQPFSLASVNPYFPLTVGNQWRLEGEDEGAFVVVQITVLDEIEVVGGVATRVVEEVEWEDDELLEVSRNFFASTLDGTVCYFGEDVDIYEDGQISHEGAWRADVPGNFAGIIMPADPHPGMKFQMEGAPGVAEDAGKVVGSGPVRVPAGWFRRTIRVLESNPLEGGGGDFKVFAEGVGIIIDEALVLVHFEGGE